MRVAIAGSTGYSGQELQILLRRHPGLRVEKLLGRDEDFSDLKAKIDLVFLCTPNETSLEWAPKLLALGISVIDVSGAFRLKQHSYPEWYGFEHSAPEWLRKSEYSLVPFSDLRPLAAGEARLVANPGCFATSVLMALVPALKSGLIDPKHIVIDAKSGTTGAGRKAETRLLFSEIYGDFAPYKVGRHQHWPEIVEVCAELAGQSIHPVFVTELLPVARGISSALFLRWKKVSSLAALVAYLTEAYKDSPEIRVSTDLAHTSLKEVTFTNRVNLVVSEAFGQPVIFSVIDNLQRGAAGQALQNANKLLGFPLNEGLV